MKTIEIRIGLGGAVRLETHGYSGAECREASRFLEQALGRTADESPTLEYHRASSAEQFLEHRAPDGSPPG